MEYLLCFCPGLAENRRRVMEREMFEGLDELADVDILVVQLEMPRGREGRTVRLL